MALSVFARQTLAHAVKSQDLADEIADVVDAGSGTLSDAARTRLKFLCNNTEIGDGLGDKIDAGTAMTGAQQNALGIGLASRPVAQEIADELSS